MAGRVYPTRPFLRLRSPNDPPSLNRVKGIRLSSPIPWDLRHAEQLLFLCPCSNLTVYRRSFFAHPLCASLSCLQYGISFGNKKPDNVDRDYIVLLSNLIEEGNVQCIVE